jgi:predicted neutral ceramidase superfamily lipid hydrolase
MTTVAAFFSVLTFAWIVARIWRTSTWMAVASLVCWPVVLFALLRNWDDRESDIKVPLIAFGASLACMAAAPLLVS